MATKKKTTKRKTTTRKAVRKAPKKRNIKVVKRPVLNSWFNN